MVSVHSDRAKEYLAWQNDFGGRILDISMSPPYTPELEASSERVNRTMVEVDRSLRTQAALRRRLWPFEIKHVV